LRRRSILFVVAVVLAALPLSGFSTAALEAPAFAVRVDPSKTRIGLAQVHLDVTELTLQGGELAGRYRIRVPLFPFKNDTGTIRLRSDGPFDPSRDVEGTLAGSAHSDSGIERDVLCTLSPDRSIDIAITMNDRIVTFRTKYRRL